MKVTYCPYCNNRTLIDDRDWGLLIQCEGPRCEKFFPTAHLAEAARLASAINSTEPPIVILPPLEMPRYNREALPQPVTYAAPLDPLLTAPHRCQVCYLPNDPARLGEIDTPSGQRRATVLHRNPGRPDNCRTDLFAALYHCPACLRLLETPIHQWGEDITCPAPECGRPFVAPFDDVLHRHLGDAREGVPFAFVCPAPGCGHALVCDPTRRGRSTTGMPVVCVGCRHIILVPGSGSPVLPL